MTEEKTNNQPSVPDKGETDKGLVETEDYEKLSNEELEKLVKTGKKTAPVIPAETATKEGEPAPEPTEELPDDLKGKSAEELAKAYLNIRKLHAKQDEELGNLRKFKAESEDLDKQMKQYQIDATSRNIVENEIKGMTDVEKQKFYDDFSDDPAKALMPYISKAIKPIAVVQARQANETEINRLTALHKDDRVPYDRKAIDKIIASQTRADGRNELFDRYGSKAFEEGYKIYRDKNLDTAIEKENKAFKEKAIKEAEELAAKKSKTYTEPQGASASKSGLSDYSNIPLKDLERIIGKPKD